MNKLGEMLRYAGALGVGVAMASFGIKYQEILKSLPWQEMIPYVEGGLTAYGAGEAVKGYGEIKKMQADGQKPHVLEYIGKAMRAFPSLSLPIGYVMAGVTGYHNPLYPSVLTGFGCICGYMLDDIGKSLRERNKEI